MNKLALLLITSLFAFAVAAPADSTKEDKGGKKAKRGHFFEGFGLSEKDTEKLKKLVDGARQEKMAIMLEVQQIELDLKKIMLEGKVNLKKIKPLVVKRGDLETEMTLIEFEKDAEVQKLLTEDQWREYARKKQMMKRKHRGGKGGKR